MASENFHHFAHVWMSLQPSCKVEQHSNFWTNLGQWDLQWNSLWTWVLCTCGAFDTCLLPNTAWRKQWWCVSHGSFSVYSVSLSYLSACVWGVIGAGGRGMMTTFVSQLLQHVLGLINMLVKDLWYEEFLGSLSVKKTSWHNSLLFRNGVKQCRAGVPLKRWQTVYVENFGCYSTIIEVSSLPHRSRRVNVSSDGNI